MRRSRRIKSENHSQRFGNKTLYEYRFETGGNCNLNSNKTYEVKWVDAKLEA